MKCATVKLLASIFHPWNSHGCDFVRQQHGQSTTGIRAAELCGLTRECTFLRLDDSYLKVHGKGDKWREVPLGKDARTALYRYMTRYRKADSEEQHIFVNRNGRPLTTNGLDQMLARLAQWARITGVRCSAHTFRHTFAVNYLATSNDVYKLSRLMGHSEVKITEGYLITVKARAARQDGISIVDTMLNGAASKKRNVAVGL